MWEDSWAAFERSEAAMSARTASRLATNSAVASVLACTDPVHRARAAIQATRVYWLPDGCDRRDLERIVIQYNFDVAAAFGSAYRLYG